MAELVIRSEEDAFETLRAILDGDLEFETVPDLDLTKWVQFTYYDPEGNSSVDIDTIRALTAAQEQVLRTYAIVKYETPDIRKLSEDEREALKIQFVVKPGSSDIFGDLSAAIIKAVEQAAGQMTPTQIVILAIGTAVLWTGKSAYRSYLDHVARTQETAATREEKKEYFSTIRRALDVAQDNQRIMERALGRVEKLLPISEMTDDAKHEMLRSIPEDQQIRLQGIEIAGDAAKALARAPRTETTERHIAGRYRVVRVDTSATRGFRVKLRNVRTGEEVTAGITDALVQADQREAIQTAEWSRSELDVRLRIEMRAGKIIDASIRDAEIADDNR